MEQSDISHASIYDESCSYVNDPLGEEFPRSYTRKSMFETDSTHESLGSLSPLKSIITRKEDVLTHKRPKNTHYSHTNCACKCIIF